MYAYDIETLGERLELEINFHPLSIGIRGPICRKFEIDLVAPTSVRHLFTFNYGLMY